MKIVVRLFGGLGNKFFQYALGRSLAIKYDAELVLDKSLLQRSRLGVTPREYDLDAYNIKARMLGPEEIPHYKLRFQRPFNYLYTLRILKSPFFYYREPHFEYDPNVQRLDGDLIIDGYWQSERYFKNIAERLRNELTLLAAPPLEVQKLLTQISEENAISLHIRRGDYISCPKAATHFAKCNIDYYQRAVHIISKSVKNPVFFLFSDDPDWVENELQLDFPTIMASQPHKWNYHEDMRLMRKCMHHIIANSSFSWWGAWLNPSRTKVVIAPSQWFRIKKNTSDLFPADWTVI